MSKPYNQPLIADKRPSLYLRDIFVAEYLSNGNNATQAYLAARPKVTAVTARANGSRMLARADVRALIDQAISKQVEQARGRAADDLASQDRLIRETHDVFKTARSKRKLSTSLQAIELKGKLAHRFTEPADTHNYKTFIKNVYVQQGNQQFVEKEDNAGADVLDVESGDA